MTKHRLREDLLWRLRWNLATPLSQVSLATGPWDHTINVPFLNHTLAEEPLFDTRLSCIDEVFIRDFADKEDREIYYDADEPGRYVPPPQLKIVNANGSAITLRQFVGEVHAYVRLHMEELRRVKGEVYGTHVIHANGTRATEIVCGRPAKVPDDAGIFFYSAMPIHRDGKMRLRVWLLAEGEALWPKDFWETRLRQIGWSEARRQAGGKSSHLFS